MFNNDSNTSLVMVGGPYHHAHQGLAAYKPASPGVTAAFNHLADPRLAPRPQHDYYLHQRRTIEIIQLEEVPPPSKREHISVPGSSSWASSSSYASSSAYSSEDDEEEEEEEEEAASESYCSSEEQSVEDDEECSEEEEPEPRRAAPADSYSARMRRIEQWRDAYAKAVGAQFAPSPLRSKRKVVEDESSERLSHSSKRSRHAPTQPASITGSAASTSAASVRSVSVHSCSACDAWFPDRGSLHRHGFSPRTNEACRAAVEYDFEQ
ncbi:hypothetical protein ACEPAF_902 [Sanghuangporus sanghuang]